MKEDFIRYIDTAKTGPVTGVEKRTLKIPPAANDQSFWGFNDDRRFIYGVFESGLYGKRLEIADKDNPRTILYDSQNNDVALMKPFFFLVFIPRIGDTAFVILERTDNEGISSLFYSLLASFLHEKRPINGQQQDYSIKPENYLSHEYVDNLKNGTIKSVKFSLRKLPEDPAERYMCESLDATDMSISLTVNFKGGLRPGHEISQAIKDNQTIFSSEVLDTLFNDSEKTIVTESIINGVSKSRTVYLSADTQNHIRPYYIIDVAENEKGYSEYTSIRDAVFTFIDDNPDMCSLN